MSIVNEFKTFILRGNVVDLAVGVVIGAAFASVVTAFTKDLLTPLIAIPQHHQASPINFQDMFFRVGGSKFMYGDFINAILTFLLTAFVVFFFVVRPVNWLMTRKKTETPVEATTRECPLCLSSIPVKASRCAFCTAEVGQAAVPAA